MQRLVLLTPRAERGQLPAPPRQSPGWQSPGPSEVGQSSPAVPCPQVALSSCVCCPRPSISPAAKKQGMGMSHSCLWAHRLSPVGTKGRRGCRASGAGSSAAKSPWPRQDGGRCTARRGAEHRARWCPHPVPLLSPGSRFTPGVSPVAGRAVGERLLLRASRAGGSHTGSCTGLWESKQVGWASGFWAQKRSFALPYLIMGLLEGPFWGCSTSTTVIHHYGHTTATRGKDKWMQPRKSRGAWQQHFPPRSGAAVLRPPRVPVPMCCPRCGHTRGLRWPHMGGEVATYRG